MRVRVLFLTGEWLGNAGAMERVVGGWLVDFWGLWCRIVVLNYGGGGMYLLCGGDDGGGGGMW
jgi:hypothetical protein